MYDEKYEKQKNKIKPEQAKVAFEFGINYLEQP